MGVDLLSGQERRTRPEDYCTKSCAVAWKPDTPTPLWSAFLDRVTRGDTELQAYLQRVCGYCMTGHTSEHVLFFLYGLGANGKSVFVNTIAGILGSCAVTAPIETFLEAQFDRHPTEIAMLRGARLVTASEPSKGRRWNEGRIKALTGGDPIRARFMRQDFFEFKPQFKIMISGNHKPTFRAVNEAIRRRIHLIPFTVTIPPEERDLRLSEKLRAEWPGILAWMVDGCLEWRRQGLNPPTAVLDATEKYLAEEDAISRWFNDCCAADHSAWTTSKALFASYTAWADANGERPGSSKAFGQALEDMQLGFTPERQNGDRGWRGIKLV